MRKSTSRYWALFCLFLACDGQEADHDDAERVEVRSQALANDADGDGVADASDNCPKLPNSNQANTNGTGPGDACEVSLVLSSGLLNQYARFQSNKELLLTYAPLTFSLGPDLMKVSAKAPSGAYANYFLLTQKLGVTSLSEVLSGAVDAISSNEILSLGLGSDSILGGGKATDVYLRINGTATVSVAFFEGTTARGTQSVSNTSTGVRRFTPTGGVLFDRVEIRATSGKFSLVGPNEAVMFALGQATLPCAAGYERVGANCVDINECTGLNHVCDALTTCTNTPGSYTCSACPSGYSGTGATTCVDINECTDNSAQCSVLVTCSNTAGSYQCGACPAGYRGDGHICTDINECSENLDHCDPLVTCTNRAGGYDCGTCPQGYSGGGLSGCVDINECTGPNHVCDSLTTCTNTAGSYTCGACPSGYRGDGRTCTDIDECAEGSAQCSPLVQCGNTAGSYQCGACPTGFSGDGRTCADLNECANGTAQCATGVACTNTVGSYTCGACPSGYTGDGRTCTDIDECASAPCDPRVTCTNAPGGFSCGACPSGFRGDGYAGCIDIDECAEHLDTCSPLVTCGNTLGAYACSACPTGYQGDGHTCSDIDECTTHTAQCDALVSCTNSIGGYSCGQCPSGYTGDGHTCADINECSTSPCHPLTACTNTGGSYTCSACPTGYQGDGYAGCLDIDECAVNNGGCPSTDACVNTQGSRTCSSCAAGSVGVITHCGVGACAATGTTSCSFGAIVNSCTPGQPAASDNTCNNVDDDCNSSVDDGFAPSVSHCGVGACAATGTVSCSGGTVTDSCRAGTPPATSDTCNGIDDDCDGSLDEDFVSQVTHCGTAACQASGTSSCVGGVVSDSCTPPSHAASDATCDGLDDDCDGMIDDDYPAVSVDCTAQGCATTTGTRSCVGGHVVDSCLSPGSCTSEAACDDGVDNDGDHAPDCQDSDCFNNVICRYENCGDGHDNDGDGAIDCRDSDCGGPASCAPLLPDPSTIVSPLADERPSSFAERVQHLLFSQYGMTLTADDFDSERMNVVSGYVQDTTGAPLAGVRVSLHQRPDLGFTFTREDGRFDLLTNAADLVTVAYEAAGFVTAHRTVRAVWEQYAFAPDLVMTPVSSTALTVGFPAATDTVFRADLNTDDDGPRQATLIIPAGTEAMVRFSDGYSESLPYGTLRATELSVGALGPKAIAAPRAMNMAYGYQVELTLDEVPSGHGEPRVEFSAPLAFYLDNFMHVPVGMGVPVGSYDRTEAAWSAERGGQVVKVIAVPSDGLALLDVDGDDIADGLEQLARVGITDAERHRVGQVYAPGKTLWRVSMEHFTLYGLEFFDNAPREDLSPPGACGDWKDASDPNSCAPCGDKDLDGLDDCTPYLGSVDYPDDRCPTCGVGSNVGPTNGSLGHKIPLIGTPLSMNYDNGATTKDLLNIRLPLTGLNTAPNLIGVKSYTSIAGRMIVQNHPVKSGQVYAYDWDGKDNYGRTVTGAQTATVYVCHTLKASPQVFWPAEFCHGSLGYVTSQGVEVRADRAHYTFELCRTHQKQLRAKALLQPWRPSFENFLDREHDVMFTSDGRVQLNVNGLKVVASDTNLTAPGANTSPFEWGPKQPLLFFRDGSLLRVDNGIAVRLRADGSVQTLGNVEPSSVYAVTRQGFLFVYEPVSARIYRYRVTPEWTLTDRTVVAGGGFVNLATTALFPSYNIPWAASPPKARSADLRPTPITNMRGLPDGSLLLTGCPSRGTICRMATDGSLTTFYPGIEGLYDVADDGAMVSYTQDPNSLFRRLQFFQANRDSRLLWNNCIDNSSGQIVQGTPDITHVALDQSHQVYVALKWDDGRPQEIRVVRQLNSTGGNPCYSMAFTETQIGTWPLIAKLLPSQTLLSMGVGPNAHLYYLLSEGGRVSMVRSNGAVATAAIAVPDLTGASKLYNHSTDRVDLFDKQGQYLASQHPKTRAFTAAIQREAGGRPSEYVDAYGNVTRFIHDYNGKLVQVTGPYGQTTTFSYDSAKRLERVEAPGGAAWTMTYHPNSNLLKTFTLPNGKVSTHGFDDRGLVASDDNPAGGRYALSRAPVMSAGGAGQEVVATDGDGVPTRFSIARGLDGAIARTRTDPAGRTHVMATDESHTRETTVSPANTHETRAYIPDPIYGLTRPITSRTRTYPSGRQSTSTEHRTANAGVTTDIFVRNGRTSSQRYDEASRTWTLTSPGQRKRTITISDVGDVETDTRNGITTSFSRDGRGRLIEIERAGRVQTFEYGADGLLSAKYGPRPGDATFFGRNALGQITRIAQPDGSVTTLNYENFELASIAPPGRDAHLLGWSPLGSFASYTPPGGVAQTLAESLGGRPGANTLPSGRVLAPNYSDGLLTSLTTDLGTTTFQYSPSTGQLSRAVTGDGVALDFGYDGELPTSTGFTWSDLPEIKTMSFEYDAQFQLEAEWLGGTVLASYGYDDDGFATRAGVVMLARDPSTGVLQSAALQSLNTSYTYDDAKLPMARRTTRGSSVIYDEHVHERDEAGRIKLREETIGGEQHLYEYSYDAHGRLERVTKDGQVNRTFSYDANGNRDNAREWGALAEGSEGGSRGPIADHNASYDPQDRIAVVDNIRYLQTQTGTSQESVLRAFTYDADGYIDTWTDQDTGATTDLDYDALGNLRRATLPDGHIVSYDVDAMQRRVGRRVNGVVSQRWIYRDALRPAAEFDADGALVSAFIYAEEANVPSYIVKNGINYRIVSDHLGSVRLVVDAQTGNVVQRMDYDEFGQVTMDTNPGFQPFGFAGGFYDPMTGLLRYGARDYDAMTGRWTARDPALYGGGQTNLYAYVGNDPVNRFDATGLWDAFLFGSVEAATPGPVRFAYESVGIFGYNSDSGFYGADIFAKGYQVGTHSDYGAFFEGVETTTSGVTEGINLYEVAGGPELPFFGGIGVGAGLYDTDGGSGLFFFGQGGAIGERGSLGFGFALPNCFEDWKIQ